MKTLLVTVFLLAGMSCQVFSMGHPHNVFAARKQMRAKSSAVINKSKINPTLYDAPVIKTAKTVFSTLIAGVCYHFHSTQSVN